MNPKNHFMAYYFLAMLHILYTVTIIILCPGLPTYVINSYREPARLFVTGGKEIKSAEGTTQRDPIAMSLYAISLQPLISRLSIFSQAKQCWYADDATGAGSLEELRKWWNEVNDMGPSLGYHPNASKCWLVTKPEKEQDAKNVFTGTAININYLPKVKNIWGLGQPMG